jgi:hypothetical protein
MSLSNICSSNNFIYTRTQLKRHRLMRHLVYNVGYSVVPIISSLLTITLYSPAVKTLVYIDPKYSVPFMTFDSTQT